ncbi:hypothetical protein FIBSPDRAFT_876899 [Athelia psychrophila]|uniref:Uncharacterized protein n=1 Tax=Athelia psychrophila TaxID=1759441 RepID=A0A167WF39_9AGAM|nr:hypothetical protein FIBSPDRAFT_876899 [Fibularhizoctonia sp. CBS 109695]
MDLAPPARKGLRLRPHPHHRTADTPPTLSREFETTTRPTTPSFISTRIVDNSCGEEDDLDNGNGTMSLAK